MYKYKYTLVKSMLMTNVNETEDTTVWIRNLMSDTFKLVQGFENERK